MITIKIIIGSTRPNRFGPQPAKWIYELAQQEVDKDKVRFEVVDLADINLPLLDEPIPPSQGKYTKDHTKAWSKIVDSADGYILVTPEYNHSTSAALKNALDFVSREWSYKPVSLVGYGATGGGLRAVEHLR
nr:NAD(P)H-dependent oxidoreductase [bacterium]